MQKCAICGDEIGFLSFKINFDDGSVVCANCAKKAGITSNKDLEGLTFDLLAEWVAYPEKREEYYNRKREEAAKKLAEQQERLREQQEQQERERQKRLALEEAEKEKKKRKKREEAERIAKEKQEWEKAHFPDGRIHTSVFEININNWRELDKYIQKIQDKGNIIIDVVSTGIVLNTNCTPVIISYRKPLD